MNSRLILLQLLLIAIASYGKKFCKLTEVCWSPNEYDNESFFFYDVNPAEGFNLRRDVYMRFAEFTKELRKDMKTGLWTLVLPPWYNLVHWKTPKPPKPIPWKQYFEIDSLKKAAPVFELSEVFERYDNEPIVIDVLYILQNYENPFEKGVFKEKWEFSNKPCNFDVKFWGTRNITVREARCVKFQGKIKKLVEIIEMNQMARKVMFTHGEIPLHNSYGTKSFWDIRRSMVFNKNLDNIARKFIRSMLDCDNTTCQGYVSVHWRRQDYAYGRHTQVPSIIGTASQIDKFITRYAPRMSKVFIATDGSTRETSNLERLLIRMGYKVYFYVPDPEVLETYYDGGVAIIDQIICTHAAFFIGSHESTFTLRIQEEREIMGFDQGTTYNRLCPDVGKCDRCSRWPVVW